jgi:hypothetical protein
LRIAKIDKVKLIEIVQNNKRNIMNKLLDYINKIRNQYAKAFALTIHH